MIKKYTSILGIIFALLVPTVAGGEEPAVVSNLKITLLSTMLTEFRGVGEWGFAALIEADGHVVLASAHEPRLAAPVSGHFRGNGVGSSMSYRVEVRAAPMAPGPGEP